MKQPNSKDVLLSQLNGVKQMCKEPKLYLSNYFSNLRQQLQNQINISLEQARLELSQSEVINANQRLKKMQTRLKRIKQSMSSKIDSFERFCLDNQFKLDSEQIKTRIERLNSLELLLNEEEAAADNLQEFNKLIHYEEAFILKRLLHNKTIVLLDLQDFFDSTEFLQEWDELEDIEDSDFFLDRIPKIEEIENQKSPYFDIYEIEDQETKLITNQQYPYYITESNKPSVIISEPEEDEELTAIFENNNNKFKHSNPNPALNEEYTQFVKSNKIRELKRIEKVFFRLVIINDEFVQLANIRHKQINKELSSLNGELIKMIALETLLKGQAYILEGNIDLANLESFSLNETINEIKANAFQPFKSLQHLDLSNNAIASIDKQTFSGLVNLQTLNLNKNNLTQISTHTFNELNHLKVLNLSSNQINELNERAFYGLESLEKLNLTDNSLTEINSGTFSQLIYLKELHLSKNQLMQINSDIFLETINLELLDLSNNSINEINADSFVRLEHLLILLLNGNRIHEINDNAFRGLINLATLNLDDNLLDQIKTNAFHELNNLNLLALSNNSISKIEANAFHGLEVLFDLDLSHNKIDDIDIDGFRYLNSLANLNLSSNQINEIVNYTSTPFHGLNNLETVSLYDNPIDKQKCKSELDKIFENKSINFKF